MFELIASIVALCSLGVSAVLAFRVKGLSERLKAVESRLTARPSQAVLPEIDRPLQGISVALLIEQDHPHPVFANLLKELLLREDACVGTEDANLSIEGRIICNGYADVYYSAELTCEFRGEAVCVLIEKPPHGDRQENLARELVARLKKELSKTSLRSERQAAIHELGPP